MYQYQGDREGRPYYRCITANMVLIYSRGDPRGRPGFRVVWASVGLRYNRASI